MNTNNNILTIGVLGRFAHQKGFDIFLHALVILKGKKVPFKAIIAGDGELKNEYIKTAQELGLSEYINFMGWVKDKEKFFSKIDIFCLSSRDEAFGIVLLEAMKFKKPILATDCDGPRDIFEDGINGLLCKKNDPQSIANGLERLLSDPPLRNKLGQAGYETLVNNYTMDIVGEKIDQALKKIAADFKK